LDIGTEVGSGLVRTFTAVPVDLAAPELDISAFVESDLALALKVYTTLERQRVGAGVRLLQSIPGRQVVVSLPVRSLGGRRTYSDPEGELERLADQAGLDLRASRTIGPELYAHLVR
jgi:16S rRNA (guanine(1405)-N(7))-methyltransferase